jgi:membrane fusion protein (multidrug efflux system)
LLRPFVATDDARVAATLVRVAPEAASGRVVRLAAQEGDHVKKGDVLVELDHRLAEAQLQKSRARADFAEHELRRVSALVSQHGLPERELDSARANAETARAELTLAEISLQNMTIASAIDGIVVQKTTEEGNIVEPGQTLLTISDADHAWIAANIEETSVGAVRVGQSVRIFVDEGGELRGTVAEVRASVAAQFALIPSDNGAGNFTKVVQRVPIKVRLDEQSKQAYGRVLRPGQSVEIKIRVR